MRLFFKIWFIQDSDLLRVWFKQFFNVYDSHVKCLFFQNVNVAPPNALETEAEVCCWQYKRVIVLWSIPLLFFGGGGVGWGKKGIDVIWPTHPNSLYREHLPGTKNFFQIFERKKYTYHHISKNSLICIFFLNSAG